nr:hypothetical protein [Tanacetum cinerariifolium]
MTKKPSIARRNKVNWHYVRDDILFSTIKVVLRHQNTQQYGAILPIELTTEDIRNTKAYKEYYACTTEEADELYRDSSSTSSFVTNLLNPIIDPVFRFEDRVKSLEVNFSKLMWTNQSTEAVSNISGLVHQYMHQEMTEAIREANLYKALVKAYDADKTIMDSYGKSAILKRRREDDDDQEETSAGSDRGSKRRREGGEHALASTPSEPSLLLQRNLCRLPVR